MDEGKFKRELDHYLTTPPEYKFCNREWGTCPDSDGEPHLCMWTPGHADDHVCGTCEAKLPLSPDEESCLEERHHAQ